MYPQTIDHSPLINRGIHPNHLLLSAQTNGMETQSTRSRSCSRETSYYRDNPDLMNEYVDASNIENTHLLLNNTTTSPNRYLIEHNRRLLHGLQYLYMHQFQSEQISSYLFLFRAPESIHTSTLLPHVVINLLLRTYIAYHYSAPPNTLSFRILCCSYSSFSLLNHNVRKSSVVSVACYLP